MRIPLARLAVAATSFTAGWLAPATPATAQLPPVIGALEGEWVGSGVLLGRPAAFLMAWTPLRDGFVRLSFTNMWIGTAGDTTVVLSSEAIYGVDGGSALGVWLDDRPQQLTLSATLTDSSFVTEWTAPAEAGRTEYRVRSPDELLVRDYVISGGTEQLFAEGTYRRATGTAR